MGEFLKRLGKCARISDANKIAFDSNHSCYDSLPDNSRKIFIYFIICISFKKSLFSKVILNNDSYYVQSADYWHDSYTAKIDGIIVDGPQASDFYIKANAMADHAFFLIDDFYVLNGGVLNVHGGIRNYPNGDRDSGIDVRLYIKDNGSSTLELLR